MRLSATQGVAVAARLKRLLNDLLLNSDAIIQSSRSGETVAVVLGKTPGATLSLVGSPGVVSLSGDTLRATSTAFSLGALAVTIRQTLGAQTKDQTFNMTVYPRPAGQLFDREAQVNDANRLFDLPFLTPVNDAIWNPNTNPTGTLCTFFEFGADGTEAGRWAAPNASRTLSYSNGVDYNGEGETYSELAWNGVDPFTMIEGGGLLITAREASEAQKAAYGSRPATSGMLRTRTYSRKFGYFECRMLVPSNIAGAWPAAWAYDVIGSETDNGSELDVVEAGPIFNQPSGNYAFQNTHPDPPAPGQGNTVTVLDPPPFRAYRTFAGYVSDEAICYTIDGTISVIPFPTPAVNKVQHRLLLNLATGWFAGSAADAIDMTALRAGKYKLYVDYMRDTALKAGAPSLLTAVPGTVTFPLVFTSTMPSGVGHARNSEAYAPTSSGGWTKFAAGQPARTDLGILVEPAGANLLGGLPTYVINASLTSTGITDPAGGTAGVRLTDGGTGNVAHLSRGFTAMNASTQYAISTFVKRAVGSANLNIGNGSRAGYSANFNPSGAGTITQAELGTSAIKAYDAWYRVQTVFSNPASGSENIQDFYITKGTTGSGVFYTADGTALDFWGTQLELGGKVTSPMPSGSRSATSVAFKIPAGITTLTYTFDNDTTQAVSVTPNSDYFVPTNLNRAQIKQIAAS